MLDVFICLVYITSWLTMLTILDWQMRGAFVGIYAKALGFLVLGQNAVGISMRFVWYEGCTMITILGLVGLYWDEGTWYFQWDFYGDSKRAFGWAMTHKILNQTSKFGCITFSRSFGKKYGIHIGIKTFESGGDCLVKLSWEIWAVS